jgi:hypothetical protein
MKNRMAMYEIYSKSVFVNYMFYNMDLTTPNP